MAKNYARRASDGRRAVNKRGLPTATVYTDGTAALALVKNELPKPKLVDKPLTLIPRVLVVGDYNRLLGSYAVTLAGQYQRMNRAQINDLLTVRQLAKRLPKTKTLPAVKAESVPLLPMWCASTKKITTPALATAA